MNRYHFILPEEATIKIVQIQADKDIAFVCTAFNLKKEELKWYTCKQLR